MTNFNSINNLRFYVSQNGSSVQNSKPAGIVDDSLSNLTQNTSNMQNETTSLVNPSLLYNYSMAKMDYEVMMKYLLNMMSLPDSIDKFIQKAAQNSKDFEMIKVLVENLISTKALAEFLNEKSKIAVDKTMQAISNSLKAGLSDSGQLRDILSILNIIQSQSSSNSNILKEFLLLYIPVSGQIYEKQLEYIPMENDEEKEVSFSELSLMFETLNFSNILCTINVENNDVTVFRSVFDNFPSIAFEKVVKTFSKEANINLFLEYKIKQNAQTNTQNQNFKVVSKSRVSINVLILAHLIIKTIFKLDNDFI